MEHEIRLTDDQLDTLDWYVGFPFPPVRASLRAKELINSCLEGKKLTPSQFTLATITFHSCLGSPNEETRYYGKQMIELLEQTQWFAEGMSWENAGELVKLIATGKEDR